MKINWKKCAALNICGLLVLLGATFGLWYDYPKLSLSFFAVGNGEPEMEFSATDENDVVHTIFWQKKLTAEPDLYTIPLQISKLKNLSFSVKNYEGYISFDDVFISGRNFKNLQPVANETLNILNSGKNSLSFTMGQPIVVNVCNDCYLDGVKKIKPLFITLLVFVYAFVTGGILFCRLFHDKLKEKLLKIYLLKNYAKIYPFAKPYWARALLAIVITIPVGSMDAVIAWSLRPFMDVVLVEKQTGWTMYIPLMIVAFSVLQALFTYIATYMNTWVGNKIALDVKRKMFNKLLHNDASFFDSSNSGEVLFRFNNDAELACSGLLNNMKMFTTRFFSSLSLICVLFYNSWQLAIIAVVVLFGALYPLSLTRKRLKKVICKDANVMATLLARYNESFNGNRIISAYNLAGYCKEKFKETVNMVFELGLQMIKKTGVISPFMHVISSFGIAFIIWFGSYLIVTHEITVGCFASFITSLVMLYNPIKSIGNNYNNIIFSLMAVERVFEILDAPVSVKNAANPVFLKNCKGDITYDNVSFEYVSGKKVLKNINLKIKAGQTIALVGNSGGGKTTISSLLPRFYDVKSGKILIDGINVKNIDLNNLRDNIAIVFQDNFLFGGTIRENILFGRQDVSEKQLNQAIEAACLNEFIATLDDGINTQIGEKGVLLSGGQRQRIAIARAFIKNAPILILDEATSALDNKSEAVVQRAIDNLMKDRTVMVIAHRLSTVRHADKIVVINDGRIVEIGSHDELLKKDGAYAALYKTQLA